MVNWRGAAVVLTAFLAVAATSAPALADSLDDASIRAFYARGDSAPNDPVKTRAIMEEQLDDNFIIKLQGTIQINNEKPQENNETDNKAQEIDAVVDAMRDGHSEKLDSKVTNITYASDHRSALVTYISTEKGSVDSPKDDPKAKPAHYEDGESCIEKVALVGNTLKVLQSVCNDRLVIHQ